LGELLRRNVMLVYILSVDSSEPHQIRKHFIEAKQFHIIRENFRKGIKLEYCSPVYSLSKDELARVITASNGDLVELM
jgi:hypothetical protein